MRRLASPRAAERGAPLAPAAIRSSCSRASGRALLRLPRRLAAADAGAAARRITRRLGAALERAAHATADERAAGLDTPDRLREGGAHVGVRGAGALGLEPGHD